MLKSKFNSYTQKLGFFLEKEGYKFHGFDRMKFHGLKYVSYTKKYSKKFEDTEIIISINLFNYAVERTSSFALAIRNKNKSESINLDAYYFNKWGKYLFEKDPEFREYDLNNELIKKKIAVCLQLLQSEDLLPVIEGKKWFSAEWERV